MTVSSTSSRVVYNGNGSTTTFPFGFKVQQAADLVVVYTDATGTDFTLSPAQYGATGFGVDAGGTVTYPLSGSPIASGTTPSISNQGAMWPQVIEAALDRLTYIAQSVSDTISRALVISPTDGGSLSPLPNRTLRANAVLGFDGTGQPYAAQLVAGLGAASAWLVTNFFPMNSAAAARGALGALAAGDNIAFTGTNTFPTPSAGDNSQKAATTAYADRAATSAVGAFVIRSYLAGLQLSTAGASSSFGVGAGMVADGTNAAMISLATALTKTTAAWAAGTGSGALDTGTIANNSWYHVHLIKRTDTGVVDVLASLSATSPTLPANYTLSRRIGAMRTDGSANWRAFLQLGDTFHIAPVTDYNSTSTLSPTLTTFSVPTGIVVQPILTTSIGVGSAGNMDLLLAPGANSALLARFAGTGTSATTHDAQTALGPPTNTSAQLYLSVTLTSGSITEGTILTKGWVDRRGQDL
jgi:hypothetical protein